MGKLWALHLGIRLAQELKLGWVVFEMDSQFIVNMVRSGQTPNAFLQPLLSQIIVIELLIALRTYMEDFDITCISQSKQIRFWEDLWIPNLKELLQQIASSILDGELHFPVAHYADVNGWRWSWLRNHLSDHICSLIASIKPPRPGQTDFSFWNESSDGNFSLKAAYAFLFSFDNRDNEVVFPFKLVWKWRGLHL